MPSHIALERYIQEGAMDIIVSTSIGDDKQNQENVRPAIPQQ